MMVFQRFRLQMLSSGCSLLAMGFIQGCGANSSDSGHQSSLPISHLVQTNLPQTSPPSSDAPPPDAPKESRYLIANLNLVAQRPSPKDVLKLVMARYQKATQYSDKAELVAESIDDSGKRIRAVAPLSVWLRDDQLWIRAYQTRVWSDGQSITAHFVGSSARLYENQILRRKIDGGRPKQSMWTLDPILTAAVGEGAGGPPPQLEWLFADKPMEKMFNDEHQFEWKEDRAVDQHPCAAIEVNAKGDKFTFWIDQKSALIRRVDFPSVELIKKNDSGDDGPSTAPLRVALRINNAQFGTKATVPQRDPLPSKFTEVNRFVPPPQAPNAWIGRRLQGGDTIVSNRLDGGNVVWFLQSKNSEVMQWTIELAKRLTEADEKAPPIDLFLVGKNGSSSPRNIADSSSNMSVYRVAGERLPVVVPDETLILVKDRTIHWVQSMTPPITTESIGGVTADLAAGVDVATRWLKRHQDNLRRYEKELDAARIQR